jgi:hypothetical protein
LLEGDDRLELSFVELVVVASECSEDESEIFDLVDGLIDSGRVRLMETRDGVGGLGAGTAQ